MKYKTKNSKNIITACAIGLSGIAFAATSEKYTYDASGNIIEKSIDGVVTRMSYDKSNRLTSSESNKGKNGCLSGMEGLPKTEASTHCLPISYSHGYDNKVIRAAGPQGTSQFYYNAEGQLIGKKTNGQVSTYTWDSDNLVVEGSQAFINEPDGNPLIASEAKPIVTDYLGNTLLVGTQQFTPTAYGEGLEEGRFTGKIYVKELASFVFPHRFYSPKSAAWTAADPSGYPDGTNNYAYVGGDPLSRVDPSGLKYKIAVSTSPAPHLTDSAHPTTALKIEGEITNTIGPGEHPTELEASYKTKGSGTGLFTTYSGEIIGKGKIYCNADSGSISAYQLSGSWNRTGNAGAVATKVTTQLETDNSRKMTSSSNHAGTTQGGATITGAGFTAPGGAGGSLSWSAGANAIDCTTSCVYEAEEY